MITGTETIKRTNMEIEQNIKGLRIRLDAYASLIIEELNPLSKETNKAKDELLLAKAWLGKALGAVGVGSPYRNDGHRESVDDIEKTAETANMGTVRAIYKEAVFKDRNIIQRVDWLREAIKDTLKSTLVVLNYGNFPVTIGSHTIDNVITHLSEARFWLGFELERQKGEAKTK